MSSLRDPPGHRRLALLLLIQITTCFCLDENNTQLFSDTSTTTEECDFTNRERLVLFVSCCLHKTLYLRVVAQYLGPRCTVNIQSLARSLELSQPEHLLTVSISAESASSDHPSSQCPSNSKRTRYGKLAGLLVAQAFPQLEEANMNWQTKSVQH